MFNNYYNLNKDSNNDKNKQYNISNNNKKGFLFRNFLNIITIIDEDMKIKSNEKLIDLKKHSNSITCVEYEKIEILDNYIRK